MLKDLGSDIVGWGYFANDSPGVAVARFGEKKRSGGLVAGSLQRDMPCQPTMKFGFGFFRFLFISWVPGQEGRKTGKRPLELWWGTMMLKTPEDTKLWLKPCEFWSLGRPCACGGHVVALAGFVSGR